MEEVVLTCTRLLEGRTHAVDAYDESIGTGTAGTANFWFDNHCATDNLGGLLCD